MGVNRAESKSLFYVLHLRSWQTQVDGLAALQRLHQLFRSCYGHSLSTKPAFGSLKKIQNNSNEDIASILQSSLWLKVEYSSISRSSGMEDVQKRV